MSAKKLAGFKSMSALGIAREMANIFNNTFFFQGAVTFSTNGNAVVAHGLGAAPTFFAGGLAGSDVVNEVDVQAADATNVTLHYKAAADGADVTSGTVNVWVIASTVL